MSEAYLSHVVFAQHRVEVGRAVVLGDTEAREIVVDFQWLVLETKMREMDRECTVHLSHRSCKSLR